MRDFIKQQRKKDGTRNEGLQIGGRDQVAARMYAVAQERAGRDNAVTNQHHDLIEVAVGVRSC
jgi:hypothetical protein